MKELQLENKTFYVTFWDVLLIWFCKSTKPCWCNFWTLGIIRLFFYSYTY